MSWNHTRLETTSTQQIIRSIKSVLTTACSRSLVKQFLENEFLKVHVRHKNTVCLTQLFYFLQVLSRLKYLCINNYNDKYYNFRCIQEQPTDGQLWYTICGTPYENKVEHIVVISSLSVLCMTWCLTLMRSGSWPATKEHRKKPHLKENWLTRHFNPWYIFRYSRA